VNATIDTAHFKRRLLEERERAQEALDYLHQEDQGQIEDDREEIQSDNHPGDMATSTFDRELDYTLEDNVERALAAIDGALKRIEDGTYGICTNRGEQIPVDRLEAIPWTTLCIDCKRLQERA
jgi:RNA polymerase-binding protein DksA